jgi:mannosyltransferase
MTEESFVATAAAPATPRDSGVGGPRSPRWVWALVGAEVVLSLILGFVKIGSKPLWQDEGFSAMIAGGAWHQLWHTLLHQDPNMAGYDVVLRFWRTVGTGAAGLRSLSALAIAAAVPFMFLLGRRLMNDRAGLLSGLFFATAPFVVHYQQEVRSYGLLLLCVVAASYCFLRMLDRDGDRFWVAYAILAAVGVYFHYFMVFVIAAHALSLLLRAPRDLPIRRIVRAGVLLIVLFAPAALLTLVAPHPGTSWIKFSRTVVTTETRTLTGGRVLFGAFAIAGVAVVATLAIALRRSGRSEWAFNLGVPVFGVAVPIFGSLVYSAIVEPFFVARYLIVVLPALVLLLAMALAMIRIGWIAIALTVVVIVVSAAQLRSWYRRDQIENWPAIVAHVTADASPRDGIVFCNPGFRPAFEYYLRDVPSDRRPAPVSPSASWSDGGVHEDPAPASAASAAAYERVWVISSPEVSSAAQCRAARAGRTKVGGDQILGIDAELWSRPG